MAFHVRFPRYHRTDRYCFTREHFEKHRRREDRRQGRRQEKDHRVPHPLPTWYTPDDPFESGFCDTFYFEPRRFKGL